ncbi:DUF4956 domain-containing protein [bacterium]|nr:DUF4956 domain-containing protein [bacterium]
MASTFFDSLTDVGSPANVFTTMDVLIVLSLSFILNIAIAWTYQKTHRGVSYSQSYVHTLVMMGVTISGIMLIIGSNIARAFTLVGALSIVRFRNAIKETRDVGFIFLSMAVGMACGTRFYLMAIIMTIALSLMIFIMTRTNFGSKKESDDLLVLQFTSDTNHENTLSPMFTKYLKDFNLVGVEGISEQLNEITYLVQLKKDGLRDEFLRSLKQLKPIKKATLLNQEHTVDI